MEYPYKSRFLVIVLLAITTFAQAEKRQQIALQEQEIAEILAAQETYAYFGPAICSLSSDLPALRNMAAAAGMNAKHLDALCELAAQGYTTAPATMVKAALDEAAACVAACKAELAAEELARIADALEAYDHALQSGAADLVIADSHYAEATTDRQTRGIKKFDDIIVHYQASVGSLFVGGDEIVNHNLTVNNDLLVKGNEIVNGNLTVVGKLSVLNTGTEIFNGTLKVLEDILLPNANAAGTVGVLKLGVDPIFLFNEGTSNFFAGDYSAGLPNPAVVTGANNISIGTQANSSLTAGNNTIAIGNTASANTTDAVALGDGATSNFARGIAIGSKDSTGTGTAPTVTALNGIAIGSAFGPNNGPIAASSAIAIGGGALASGNTAVAIGGGANSSGSASVALGDAATSAATYSIGIGFASIAATNNSIAIGASATVNAASSIAIGGSTTANAASSIVISASGISFSDGSVSGTYINGISGATSAGAVAVVINGGGRLGTIISSKRFKENFRNLDAHSAQLYNLNPVKFDYKAEQGGIKDQFGLIAEEVAQHIPEIVVRDLKGEIETIQYHVLPTLLLNEMKHHQKTLQMHQEKLQELDELRAEITMLKAALAQLK